MPLYSDPPGLYDSYEADSQRSEPSSKQLKPYIRYVEFEHERDLSPSTSIYARSSVDTYASSGDSEDNLDLEHEDDLARYHDPDYIPPLPSYTHELSEAIVQPSTPKEFARLFPSLNRLSIRHDDTSDGNMNLRVDTIVPGGRRRTAIQLFHLRMYDLGKRDFSLRRYCRDSGREVCNSKRATASATRPALQRSMSSAMKSLSGAARPQFRRHSSHNSTVSSSKRPATSHSYASHSYDASVDSHSLSSNGEPKQNQQSRATKAIKLEFSNYARVDVERKGSKNSKRYEFSWWGHRYAWKRVVEKHLEGVVSFHLIRDDQPTPVAHIVPETRSSIQVEDDERAGGWVPPCYMWINDKTVLDAATDVAE